MTISSSRSTSVSSRPSIRSTALSGKYESPLNAPRWSGVSGDRGIVSEELVLRLAVLLEFAQGLSGKPAMASVIPGQERAHPLDQGWDGLEQRDLALEHQQFRARQEVVQYAAELRRVDVVSFDADQQRWRRHLAQELAVGDRPVLDDFPDRPGHALGVLVLPHDLVDLQSPRRLHVLGHPLGVGHDRRQRLIGGLAIEAGSQLL